MKWYDKGLLISIGLFLLLFPVTAQYISQALNYGMDNIIEHGYAVISVPVTYIVGYGIWRYKSKTPKLPSKGSKTQKAGEFID